MDYAIAGITPFVAYFTARRVYTNALRMTTASPAVKRAFGAFILVCATGFLLAFGASKI
jgi:hypothetical protein